MRLSSLEEWGSRIPSGVLNILFVYVGLHPWCVDAYRRSYNSAVTQTMLWVGFPCAL